MLRINQASLAYLLGFASQNTFNHLCQQALTCNAQDFLLYLMKSHTTRVSVDVWEQARKKWPKEISAITTALRNQYGSFLSPQNQSGNLSQHIQTHRHSALNRQLVRQGHLLRNEDVRALLIQAMKSRNLTAAKLIFMHCGDKIPFAKYVWYMMHRREKSIPTPILKVIKTVFSHSDVVFTSPSAPLLTHQWQTPGKQQRKGLSFKMETKRTRRCKLRK
jgi:hypothetical protein